MHTIEGAATPAVTHGFKQSRLRHTAEQFFKTEHQGKATQRQKERNSLLPATDKGETQAGDWKEMYHTQKKNTCENAEKKTEKILDSLRTQSKTWKMLRDRKEMDVKKKMHHVELWGGYFCCVLFGF